MNGNMVSDANKGIIDIAYNHLNLPTTVQIGNGPGAEHNGTISYVYDATGTKLAKQVANDGANTTTVTEYAGGFIYENGQLKMFSTPEGYVEPNNPNDYAQGFNYVYNYLDHLGNVRLTYSDSDGNGSVDASTEIISEKNYYPFGLEHKGYNNVVSANSNSVASKFKYNGKELNDELGLDWYDYGARNYEASLGRWFNIDPLAEVYYGINPYAYVFNNPVQLFDPDGMRVEYVRKEGQSRKEFRKAKREFKRKNRKLSRDSKTHRTNFKQLKKSKNVHSVSFNRGKGSSVSQKDANEKNSVGSGTNIEIDLEQKGEENEFVIAHETAHAVEDDLGISSPVKLEGIDYLKDDPDIITSKVLENQNQNREANERSASHTENVVRGEVSNSRGKKIPLRATYTYKAEYYRGGKFESELKTINVIKKNYDYYKKSN